MEVRVRLFANLRDRLSGDPREHRGRGPVQLADGASLQVLLTALEIPSPMAQMVLVNGRQVPRGARARSDLALCEGDTVSIFPPLAGG